jgi:hypothetical protein
MDDKAKEAATADEREAGFRADPRYREQESPAPGASNMFIGHVVDETLRSILDRRRWPEHMKLQARHNADVVRSAMLAVQNAPNRDFVLNLIWAALSLGLNSGHSQEWIERAARESGKKSAPVRKANWPWTEHATELAQRVCSLDQTLSNGKIASEVEGQWKHKAPKCPVHRTLENFISELRINGTLPQRTRSLRK